MISNEYPLKFVVVLFWLKSRRYYTISKGRALFAIWSPIRFEDELVAFLLIFINFMYIPLYSIKENKSNVANNSNTNAETVNRIRTNLDQVHKQ